MGRRRRKGYEQTLVFQGEEPTRRSRTIHNWVVAGRRILALWADLAEERRSNSNNQNCPSYSFSLSLLQFPLSPSVCVGLRVLPCSQGPNSSQNDMGRRHVCSVSVSTMLCNDVMRLQRPNKWSVRHGMSRRKSARCIRFDCLRDRSEEMFGASGWASSLG